MEKIYKNLTMTVFCVLIVMIIISLIQMSGQNYLAGNPCSYIDKVFTDILAMSAALFLIIEGLYRMFEHKEYEFRHQLTRIIQVCIGSAIVLLHIMQVLYSGF